MAQPWFSESGLESETSALPQQWELTFVCERTLHLCEHCLAFFVTRRFSQVADTAAGEDHEDGLLSHGRNRQHTADQAPAFRQAI
jgi:hypothetical protein